jgi:glycolate oxidase FAD binding subunit
MTDIFRPRDEEDVAAAIQWAVAEGKSVEIIGHGSKREIGRAAQWDLTVDLSALRGVTLYEPEELVLSARAGTPLSEIAALLADHGQELAFEPMDYGPILGRPAAQATLGGVLATNSCGPRRFKAGAARDHFLGVSAASGRGERFKSGGRVVKNVTGYDLCKLLAGSWGTLAAMTEVTVKVLPRAETTATLICFGLSDALAVKAMAAATGSSAEVSGAAHVPAAVAPALPPAAGNRGALTAFRLEGVPPSVAERSRTLAALLKDFGEPQSIGEAASRALWQTIRDVAPFAAPDAAGRPLWRVSTAPMKGPQIAAQITQACADAQVIYDWAGGLMWIMLAESDDAGAPAVRRTIRAAGGHATLVRAPASVRASVDVFEPQDPALAALTRRVKASFDPQRVLGSGRMYAGV